MSLLPSCSPDFESVKHELVFCLIIISHIYDTVEALHYGIVRNKSRFFLPIICYNS